MRQRAAADQWGQSQDTRGSRARRGSHARLQEPVRTVQLRRRQSFRNRARRTTQ
jgi:hypothetical protein